ncbi:MAG TPA: ABC transporter permease [Blastocatellia bacterium]|nr:ABC transporter permease [Blastocatellia bacterium]
MKRNTQLHLCLIRFVGLIVPQRLRADWRQEWEAELRHRERLLAEWDKLNWQGKFNLLWRSMSAFWDALWLQPKRLEDEMFQDLRFGIRMLLKNPGFTAVVILTMALGIGVNTALFTVFNAFALKPVPVKDVDSFVEITGVPQPGQWARRFSYPEYQDYAARTQTLVGLALIKEQGTTLDIERTGHAQPDAAQSAREEFGYVSCQLVSANYFSLFGASMALGRGFLPEEERTPGTHPVAVLSHYFWEQAFKRDPQVIGRTIRLAGQPFVIVGVTAKEFNGTAPNRPACWLPLMMLSALSQKTQAAASGWQTDRSVLSFRNMWGRLKPGVTSEQAQAELHALTAQLAREYPGEHSKATVQLKRAPAYLSFDGDGSLLLMPPLSVVLVLLIACANVANLLLARAAKRQKEIGTRLAMGATRQRIIRQLLTESMLIVLVGGGLGLLLSWWSLMALYPWVLSQFDLPGTSLASVAIDLQPDFRVFGYTLLLVLLAGLAAGLAPAWQASRPNLTLALKGEGSVFGEQLSQSRLRNALIVVQLAFSLILLVSSGLLVRSLQKLQMVDLGFETARLFAIEVDLGTARTRQTEELRQQLEARLRALPDVQSVSRASRAPLSESAPSTAVALAGQTDRARMLDASYDFVSSSQLETLGVSLLQGRNFTEQEANAGAHVVVLSAAAVRKLWPQFNDLGQALGQSLGIAAGETKHVAPPTTAEATAPAPLPVYQVIGVARDTILGSVLERNDPLIYLPLSPGNPAGEYLLVRTRTDAQPVMGMLRAEITARNPDAKLAMKATAEWWDLQLTPFRIVTNVALTLGLMALLLASIGLYGVMSFIVAQRTREIGIRVALGAEPRSILALFLKQGLRLISLGILLGLLGGVATARLLALALVDLSPFDPLTFSGVSLCLAVVALLATYLPVRRAMQVDPMIALRHE